jgi:hypothetical protein
MEQIHNMSTTNFNREQLNNNLKYDDQKSCFISRLYFAITLVDNKFTNSVYGVYNQLFLKETAVTRHEMYTSDFKQQGDRSGYLCFLLYIIRLQDAPNAQHDNKMVYDRKELR